MGFFYQALKKETGVKTDGPPDMLDPLDAVESKPNLRDEIRPVSTKPPRRKFELQHPIESLVAFLVPPVVEENILAMEQCRVLRARVWQIMHSRKMKSLLITSAMPAEGKTFLAINLAFALSHIENARVLLVDADLRRPSVSTLLKMDPGKGLISFLNQQADYEDIFWELSPSLDVVPTMQIAENSSELLHGSKMTEFLDRAKQEYDVVILDAPPLFPIVDAQVLAQMVDAALLVVRADKTPFELSRQAADLLKSKFIGSVLNGAEHLANSKYYGGYYSHYSDKGKQASQTKP